MFVLNQVPLLSAVGRAGVPRLLWGMSWRRHDGPEAQITWLRDAYAIQTELLPPLRILPPMFVPKSHSPCYQVASVTREVRHFQLAHGGSLDLRGVRPVVCNVQLGEFSALWLSAHSIPLLSRFSIQRQSLLTTVGIGDKYVISGDTRVFRTTLGGLRTLPRRDQPTWLRQFVRQLQRQACITSD